MSLEDYSATQSSEQPASQKDPTSASCSEPVVAATAATSTGNSNEESSMLIETISATGADHSSLVSQNVRPNPKTINREAFADVSKFAYQKLEEVFF
jgi:hypothetical protein